MFGLGIAELSIIAGVLVLLFGAKKVPELMGGFGKGIRELRHGIRDINEDVKLLNEEEVIEHDDQS